MGRGENTVGNAGNITVTSNYIELSGTSNITELDDPSLAGLLLRSAFQLGTEGFGSSGDLLINTDRLMVSDGAVIIASTIGKGSSGDITIRATDLIQLEGTATLLDNLPSGIGIATASTGSGGNLEINSRDLVVRDGASILAGSFGEGAGGNVSINVTENIKVLGVGANGFPSQISAGTGLEDSFVSPLFESFDFNPSTATGAGGDLEITTERMIVEDGAQVTVSNLNGLAGNLSITAESILLNQGVLSAETRESGLDEGANIVLQDLAFLQLRNNSLISAEAFENANGGNISINAIDGFIVGQPFENSDIIANADQGNGGNINISANQIFGLEFRAALTPLSDITASSEFGFDGTVLLNTLEIDPEQGLEVLPEETRETEVTDSCQTAATQNTVEFFNLGQGGSPSAPDNIQSSDLAIAPWISSQLADPTQPLQSSPLPNSVHLEALSNHEHNPLIIACHAN